MNPSPILRPAIGLGAPLSSWWTYSVRGIAAILLGLVAFSAPGPTVGILVWLFGLFAIVDGVFCIASAFSRRREEGRRWPLVLGGLAGIAAGVAVFTFPGLSLLFLIFFIGARALVVGIFEIIAAIRLRKEIAHEWLLGLSGVVSLVFGLLLLMRPLVGIVTLVWVLSLYAFMVGCVLIALSLELRSMGKSDSRRLGGHAHGV